MKKFFNKTKVALATLGIIVISFSEKIFGQEWADPQPLYGNVLPPSDPGLSEATQNTAIKIARILLVVLIFIVGIIGFIKIRKIGDKTIRGKE